MLDAAAEDAIERGSWIDSLSVLPASFISQDAYKILSFCPSVQAALKCNKALLLGDSYVFSTGFLKGLYDHLEKEIEVVSLPGSCNSGLKDGGRPAEGAKAGHDSSTNLDDLNDFDSEVGATKQSSESGSKKKKGKPKMAKTIATESDPDGQESVPAKSKKIQKKSKSSSSSQGSNLKPSTKKDMDKMKEDNINMFSEEAICQKIAALVPDFEDQGVDDPEKVLIPLANHIRPMLLNSWNERRKAAFTENGQKMKRLIDNVQKKLDEFSLNMQLYAKALDLFEGDSSTSALLHRHLLRTTATSMVDMLFLSLDMHEKLKNGNDIQDCESTSSVSLDSEARIGLAKAFTGPLSVKALAVIEALEGKRVEAFMTSLKELTDQSGLTLKKLDKKLERTLLHSYRKDLLSQVAAETDPVTILPKVVSLLYIQFYSRALQAPGRAISVAVSKLKDKLGESAYETLEKYHGTTVTLLMLMPPATSNEDNCTSDRILAKREILGSLMPALKGLVLHPLQS